MSPPNMILCHKDDFELKATKNQQTQSSLHYPYLPKAVYKFPFEEGAPTPTREESRKKAGCCQHQDEFARRDRAKIAQIFHQFPHIFPSYFPTLIIP